MIDIVRQHVARLLREFADKIDSGNTNITEDEAIGIMRSIAHQRMTKEEVIVYLNMSRSKFDTYVRFGRFPKGRKARGDKALFWYKDELDDCIRKIKFEKEQRRKSKVRKYVEEIN